MSSLSPSYSSAVPRLTVDTGRAGSTSATSRGRISHLDSSGSINDDGLLSPVTPGTVAPAFTTSQAQNRHIPKPRAELQKLLAHSLDQLRRRPKPPSVFEAFKMNDAETGSTRLGAVVETVRVAVRLKAGKSDGLGGIQRAPTLQEDSDEEDDGVFSTNRTFELLSQMHGVLTVAFDIFSTQTSTDGDNDRRGSVNKPSSPFRLRRFSAQQSGRRSRSPSPNPGTSERPSDMLLQVLSVLSSIVAEDCRYQIAAPRPSRPPNALQAVCLDVARHLIAATMRNPKELSQIAFAMLPAFSTFRSEMQARLISFFEELLRFMLDALQQSRGAQVLPTIARQREADFSADADRTITSEGPSTIAIRVEEAEDEISQSTYGGLAWVPWTSATDSQRTALVSANAPAQAETVYYLSSLVPALLVTILEHLDISKPEDMITIRFNALLAMMMRAKSDVYLDLLSVIAWGPTKTRYRALSLLARHWPKALGHNVITKSFPAHNRPDHAEIGSPTARPLGLHSYHHQFVPWRFHPHGITTIYEGLAPSDCRSCTRQIDGFGLLCPFCGSAVHFDCYDYPEGSFLSHYTTKSSSTTQKMAVYRFCDLLPETMNEDAEDIYCEQHHFRPTNLFTLSLCLHCHEPLWGCSRQAFRCGACRHFAHPSCVANHGHTLPRCRSTPLDSSHIVITWDALRESFVNAFKEMLLPEAELEHRTYEDASIFYSVLWLQLQIMNNGIALGSIVITNHNRRNTLEEFELHYWVRLYEAYLSTPRLRTSSVLKEYMEENEINPTQHIMWFDWSTLVYMTTIIKSTFDPSKPLTNNPIGLLSVMQGEDDTSDSESSQPFELVPLTHLRDALGYEIGVFSDVAARHLLVHLHHLGFFSRQDGKPSVFVDNKTVPTDVICVFPIPLGLDLSAEVETLFGAVESCLSDLDLSVNEAGFLLLTRKLWPNGMATDYALRRLARTIISWIFAEEANLGVILRDYAAQGSSLPGVRAGYGPQPWPVVGGLRPSPSNSVRNAGDYVACRRVLAKAYAVPWMLALHNYERSIYGGIVYGICEELATEVLATTIDTGRSYTISHADQSLRYVLKLAQASMVFTTSDELILAWLSSLDGADLGRQPIPSLLRLLNREQEASHRMSVVMDPSGTGETAALAAFDPWRLLAATASRDLAGFSRAVDWLDLFARSGVEVPSKVYSSLWDVGRQTGHSTQMQSFSIIRSMLYSTWMKSRGPQELQNVVADFHENLNQAIVDRLRIDRNAPDIICFIRQSVAICLLLYGCERGELLSRKLIQDEEIRQLPSRRKMTTRVSTVPDNMDVSQELMSAFKRYVNLGIDEVTCIVAEFLDVVLSDSRVSNEIGVDDFITLHGTMLCECTWQFYAVQYHEISAIRMRLLLRVLVADPESFHDLLDQIFRDGTSWELRFQAVTRLFRIILDLPNPAFTLEGRRWRSSMTEIFYRYFTAIWMDKTEEIRLSVDSWSQTLLPAHYEAISLCWKETLDDAPIAERLRLIAFLIQLRTHFPRWQVLSWDTIIRHIPDEISIHGDLEYYLGPALQEDTDSDTCSVSIVLLALRMIADCLPIDISTLSKIKVAVAQILGFRRLEPTFGQLGSVPELAYPLIGTLVKVLDAYYPYNLTPSDMGRPDLEGLEDATATVLAGSIFLDIVLALFRELQDLSSLPMPVVKGLLECLLVIIYKHDLDTKPLVHLRPLVHRAVQRCLELLLPPEMSYDIRQLALSVCLEFIRTWPTRTYFDFYCNALETAARLVASLDHDFDDPLVAQATSFVEKVLLKFTNTAVFGTLCERPLEKEFFTVLRSITDARARLTSQSTGESLRDSLIRDAFRQLQVPDKDTRKTQALLQNLKTYVEVVHNEGLSQDLMRYIASALLGVVRRAADGAAEAFNPDPVILMAATLIHHNKAHSRELLQSTETVLRAVAVRCNMSATSLTRILGVTAPLYRKNHLRQPSSGDNQQNIIAQAVVELLSDGLRNKARVLPATLTAMLEAITEHPDALPGSLPRLRDDCFFYLASYTSPALYSAADFSTSSAVAKWLLKSAELNPESMSRMLSEHSTERHTLPLSLRAWNIVVFAALTDASDGVLALILAQFTSFSFAYYSSLRPFIQMTTTSAPRSLTPADINHAYAGIKLWFLLVRKVYARQNEHVVGALLAASEDEAAKMIWNELWPPFETVVGTFDIEAQTGSITPVATSAWSSVADLFLFLHQMRSVIILDTAAHVTLLERLRVLGRGETASGKLARALASTSEPPPDISLPAAIGQVGREIAAVEKLHAAESQRKEPSKVPERSRVRIAT